MVKTLIEAFPINKRKAKDDGSKILKVSECFMDTIQGENFVGQPSTFLRLQGCSLNCTFCFGIKPGRKIPKLITKKGQQQINNINVNDVLLTYDDKFNIVETTVTKVIKRDMLDYLEITIDGHMYFVTEEHPFFTSRGLIKAKDLKINDDIYKMTCANAQSYRMKKNNPSFNEAITKKRVENTDWKSLGKKISKTINEKQKNGTYIHWWNTLNNEEKNKYRKIFSINKIGEKNPNYNGTRNNLRELKKLCKNNILKLCKICNKNKKLEVHHIDENKLNDDFNNLTTICHSCHSKIHKRGYNFWNRERKDNKQIGFNIDIKAINANGKTVQKIKKINYSNHKYINKSYGPKPIPFYNFSCEPYNSYIIDNMWVHNCDSTEVWRRGNPYSVLELVDIFIQNGTMKKLMDGQHLVLTGGSPLKQQDALMNLIEVIYSEYGFAPIIEIENECTIFPDDKMIKYVDIWNNSPKLKNSKMLKKYRYFPNIIKRLSKIPNSYFKFVVSNKNDWKEIQRDYLKPKLIEKHQIVLMPEGSTREEVQKNYMFVIDLCTKYNIRMTDRLHITIWDKKVGV